MLLNWLKPFSRNHERSFSTNKHTFSGHIQQYGPEFKITPGSLALIGIGPGAGEVREQLYRLAFPFNGLRILDLGDARNPTVNFTIPLIKEVLSSGLFPIIIGCEDQLGLACYKAFTNQRPLVSLAVASEKLFLSSPDTPAREGNYLDQILKPPRKESQLFHFAGIGCQSHYLQPGAIELMNRSNFDCVRLGKARQEPIELEPIIRDADVFNFHLEALRFSEAPGLSEPTPSGFSLDEACRISRYAGMSDKLGLFSILGFEPEHDFREQTAASIAQMLWYFIDGFYHRKDDFPASNEGLTEYLIEIKSLNYEMAFWKSQKSGRWWMQIPVKTQKHYDRHYLIPCSYSDYQMACRNELPDRLLNALKRFG